MFTIDGVSIVLYFLNKTPVPDQLVLQAPQKISRKSQVWGSICQKILDEIKKVAIEETFN